MSDPVKGDVVVFACKVSHLRHKYSLSPNEQSIEILNKILWYSVPVVYADLYEDACRALRKKRGRVLRVKKRVLLMCEVYDKVYFGDLQFNDEYMQAFSAKTKERYLKAFLNDMCASYVANEDFGAKNNRFHYHAIIAKPDFSKKWPYGFYRFEPLKKSATDVKRVVKYVSRIANHAGKITAGKVIFSRSKGGMLDDVDELPF